MRIALISSIYCCLYICTLLKCQWCCPKRKKLNRKMIFAFIFISWISISQRFPVSVFFVCACLFAVHFLCLLSHQWNYNILNFAGSSEMPQFISRRCIIMLILLFGFLMFQFYSASIVGSLLMEKPKTIKTLRNLIDSPLKLGIEDIIYNKDFFKVSTWTEAFATIHI